ncbi:MAG: exodeoxyribonuclease III [Rickettsiales bacterium]|nr:exodeoxyribonuclease III [Rickettsiales bacterium]
MRITSFNINSVRIRLHLIEQIVQQVNPDILCLQETKVDNPLFPYDELRAMGFPYIEIHGQKGYHGVAILSKVPVTEVQSLTLAEKPDARHIAVRLPDGTELHNFYVPAGGDIPDPEANPKFRHKLDYYDDLLRWSKALDPKKPVVMLGDMNVAPLEHDVWSHKQMLKIVSHTPIEIEKMTALRESANWLDCARLSTSPEEKLYSWWSYRAKDWEASDRGRRLDHIWVTPALTDRVGETRILKAARGWEKPSDHVPVTLELRA